MDEAKPRVEVATETSEELHLLDVDRKPRPEKAALEARFFDGGHEVRFTERSFKPRRDAGLDEIRAFVDALEIRKRDLPPIPEARRVEVATPPAVPDHYRAPLETVIEGALVGVETVHRVGTGTVVEAQWEDKRGALQKALFLVEGGVARPYDAVASRIDQLPEPSTPVTSSSPSSSPPPSPTSDEPRKKGLLKFGRDKPKEPKAEKPATEEKGKRRFGFGKK